VRRARLALLASAGLALAGCTTAPAYTPPSVPAAQAWREQGPWREVTTAPPAGAWWALFNDAELTRLEERLDADAPSLAIQAARYAQAQATVGGARSSLFPQVGVGASRVRRRGAGESTDIGASLAYELDVFGRLRGQLASARAEANASASDLAAVKLGLQTQLAGLYFDLREFDARLALLRDTASAFQRAHELTATRREGGIASGLDVNRAETQLANAGAEIEEVAAARAVTEHAIAVLIGENPSAFSIAPQMQPFIPPNVPAGVPSTLLLRRPDIAAAERRVAAANARIGVAKSAYFPSITLAASTGYDAGGGDLFNAANRTWAVGPLSIDLPLFDGGARKARLKISQADYDEAVAGYRNTVLTAFGEVEDGLSNASHQSAQALDQAAAARAAERTRDLALTRYRDGAANYLEVVTAQTAALDAQRALLQLRGDQMRNAADLVRALGGFYQEPATRGD